MGFYTTGSGLYTTGMRLYTTGLGLYTTVLGLYTDGPALEHDHRLVRKLDQSQHLCVASLVCSVCSVECIVLNVRGLGLSGWIQDSVEC